MRRNSKKLITSLVILLILSIGIVYAYLTSNLSITGATEIAANSWNIHFANLVVNTDSVSATTPAAINPSDNTSITYTVKLNRPKEFYEFTVDVVNEGSLPGKVSISNLSGITTEASSIVDYTINYTNGKPVNIGDILNAGTTKSIKVRVFYNDEIEVDDLPTSNLNLTLTFTLQYVQSESDEDLFDTSDLINQLKTENSSCFTKYEGEVTDQVGQTVTASNVYFNKCADKRNIIFNNMCWQMIRTTETGGIKMIYNGDVVDGKCLNNRGDHKGIVQSSNNEQSRITELDSEYLYGNSFTYDETNETFTLIDTVSSRWSNLTYENLIGKYTCKNLTGTCTTIYNINGYKDSTTAYIMSYIIGDTNYAQIGTSGFNSNYKSPAMVGYMFNKVYNFNSLNPGTNTYKFGNTFTYANGTYTLSGTTQNISDWQNEYNTISNTHYTCWNDTGICQNISYITYTNETEAYNYNISEGKSVNDALNEMLYDDNVNRYNSSIKGIIDAWYRENLLSKTNMLEDTVYCNDRTITNYGAWNPNGGTYDMEFKNINDTIDLVCLNETDQFSINNNKAKLTYPVALLQAEEIDNINNSSLIVTGSPWWSLSPEDYDDVPLVSWVSNSGSNNYHYAYDAFGTRPVISLNTGAVITKGDGSEESPFVIQE